MKLKKKDKKIWDKTHLAQTPEPVFSAKSFSHSTRDSSGKSAVERMYAVGTKITHSGSGKDFVILDIQWCAERTIWCYVMQRAGNLTAPKICRSFANVSGRTKAGERRFRIVEDLDSERSL